MIAKRRVRSPSVIGLLGNTGNTSAPPLHFHLMDGPSALGSQGVPYVIGDSALAGQIDVRAMAAPPTLVGDWGKHRLATPIVQNNRFPLDLNIVDVAGQ